MNSSSSPFGSSHSGFGQISQINSGPSEFGSFGSSTGGSLFGGPSQGVFGASSSTSIFSCSPFGLLQNGFGHTSQINSHPSGFGSFGSSRGGSLFGESSQGAFGVPSSTSISASSPLGWTSPAPFGALGPQEIFVQRNSGTEVPASGSGFARFGPQTPTPVFSGTSTGVFGATTSSLSSGSMSATTSSPTSWGSFTSFHGSQPRLPTIDSERSTFGVIHGGNRTAPYSGTISNTEVNIGQVGGSRVSTYRRTRELNSGSTEILLSISAMPIYKDRNHEELRWEDHQLKNRGGFGVDPVSLQSNTYSNSFARSENPFLNPITSSTPSTIIAPSTPSFITPTCSTSSSTCTTVATFGPKSGLFSSIPEVSKPVITLPLVSTSSTANSIWSPSPSKPTSSTIVSPFGPNPSQSLSGSFSSTIVAPSTPVNCVTPAGLISLNPFTPNSFKNSSVFNIPTIPKPANTFLNISHGDSNSITQPCPTFGPSSISFVSSSPATTTYPSILAPSIGPPSALKPTPPFGPNLFSNIVPGFGPNVSPAPPSTCGCNVGMPTLPSPGISFPGITPSVIHGSSETQNITNPPSITPTSKLTYPTSVQQEENNQTGSNGIDGVTEVGPQITSARLFPNQSTIQSPVTMPLLIYGISSRPVSEKPSTVRSSPLLTVRHLSHRKNRLPTPKYNPKSDGDGPKVAFFSNTPMALSTKEEALLPRENPRSFVTGPTEEWNLTTNYEKLSVVKHTSIHLYDNGSVSVELCTSVVDDSLYKNTEKTSSQTSTAEDSAASPELMCRSALEKDSETSGGAPQTTRSSVTGILSGADIMELMPKLGHNGYYIEPCIEELARKECSESGFCSHVKDFVVGRLGYGSIKFLGETDVRKLDIESHVQFNPREVVVYMDETKKPPVGQGLNKAAEITLFSIKCIDKETGKQYIDGPKVEKYKEMLIKKADEQGAEFVSYDPVQGEWKIRVQHF